MTQINTNTTGFFGGWRQLCATSCTSSRPIDRLDRYKDDPEFLAGATTIISRTTQVVRPALLWKLDPTFGRGQIYLNMKTSTRGPQT